jgi:hypothetical protein
VDCRQAVPSEQAARRAYPASTDRHSRWDRRAIDQALDEKSGLGAVAEAGEETEVDRWFREYEENKRLGKD